eukprot:31281-Pelagococcus_subviridis.AAC.3
MMRDVEGGRDWLVYSHAVIRVFDDVAMCVVENETRLRRAAAPRVVSSPKTSPSPSRTPRPSAAAARTP